MTDMATVANHLRLIEEMAQRLEARAVDRSNSRDLTGGDAMVNLASVGSMADWKRRLDLAEATYGNGNVDVSHEDPDELWPAVQVLWFWSEDIRNQLGHDHDDPRWRPTLVSEAKFLRNHDVAEWIWNNEPHYDDYAADVERAKTKLENILHEGDRSERSAVVCDRCDAKRPLIRVYGTEPGEDRWKCPSCKALLTDEELDDALAAQMRRGEPRQWIPRSHAVDLLRGMGHQERVAVRLVDHPDTEGYRDETTHVRWVSWPATWRRHLVEMQRRKMKAGRIAG